MDHDQLVAFIAIAQYGTVTAAAERLHRSQSAISRRLTLLESELNAPLFDRMGTSLALTDVGSALLPFAERALAAAASGREAALAQQRPGAGSVTIAIVGTLVEAPLARALGQVSENCERLSVHTCTSREVSRLVRRGDASIGVRYFEDTDPELSCRRIGEERMCTVTASSRGLPMHAQSERPTRWVGFPPGRTSKEDFGRLLRRQLASAGLHDAEIMSVDSLSAQKRLVEVGLGMALLPASSVRDEVRRGRLAIRKIPGMAIKIPIFLVVRRDAYLSPASRAAVDTLHAALSTTHTRSQV
jgi:DNA-binding transcriptional LysR family regulator